MKSIMQDRQCRTREVVLRALLLAAMLMMAAGCQDETKHPSVGAVDENEPEQTFTHSRIVVTQAGVTSAVVDAESVAVFTKQNFTTISGGIVVEFHDREGVLTSTLTAKSGDIWGLYEQVDSLRASGDVVIVSADSTKRLTSETPFLWTAKERLVTSPGPVVLSTPDAVERGIRFSATEDLSKYHMDEVSGEVEGMISTEELK